MLIGSRSRGWPGLEVVKTSLNKKVTCHLDNVKMLWKRCTYSITDQNDQHKESEHILKISLRTISSSYRITQ